MAIKADQQTDAGYCNVHHALTWKNCSSKQSVTAQTHARFKSVWNT